MILIQTDLNDISSSDVIDWLLYYKKKFIRISLNDEISSTIKLSNNSKVVKIFINDVEYNLSDLTSYWYRRSFFNFKIDKLKGNTLEIRTLNQYLSNEYEKVELFLNEQLVMLNSYGNIIDNNINKLKVLEVASSIGLKIPDTIISNDKKDIVNFMENKKIILAKAISEGVTFTSEKRNYYMHSILQNKKHIEGYPEKFPLSLFQEYVEKKYEIRVFYIDNKCYSSVIFSQLDKKTKIDFRNYNHKNPNRVCPYKLPEIIEKKISKLMKYYKFRTGSLDLIYSKNNEYVFLEINPVGQFKQVSKPCNYNLEYIIARKLI